MSQSHRIQANTSYHPAHLRYQMSPSLKRARRPFLLRNIAAGFCVVGFVGSVYAYSMMAVKQEDFSDIELPEEVKQRHEEIRKGGGGKEEGKETTLLKKP